MTSFFKYLTFGLVTLIVAFVFLNLPRQFATIAFTLFVIYPFLTIVIFLFFSNFTRLITAIVRTSRTYLAEIPIIKQETLTFNKHHLIEIIALLMIVLFVTRHHFNFDPAMRVDGHEIEWLTGYGQVAHQGLQDLGRIPRWNPYYRQGEPLVDSAFSYIFNPFSSIPHLLFGSTQGSKIGIVINGALACLGGWFLGWILGLSRVGRMALAVMILSKGNMHTNYDGGYFQLALQQVYFPWVIAGVLGVLRTTKRWAIILTALSMALMFLAGNIWHVLPTGISVILVIALHLSYRKFRNKAVYARLLSVGILAAGFGAVLLLSTIATFNLIEGHPDEVRAGWEVVEPFRTYLLPFVGDYEFATDELLHTTPARSNIIDTPDIHFYYSYVIPWWFVILIFLPIPLIWKRHEQIPNNRLIWWAGVSLYIFFTLWGMGGTPLFVWLYEHVPFIAQWRFVPRVLGMASFWVAVVIALRTDTLLQSLFLRWRHNLPEVRAYLTKPSLHLILFVIYLGATITALWAVCSRWRIDALEHMEPGFGQCLEWMRESKPDAYHVLWVHGYDRVTHMIENEIRLYNIEADYLPGTAPNTIGGARLDARQRLIGHRFIHSLEDITWILDEGYRPLKASPNFFRIEHCIYKNNDYDLPYAFTFNHTNLPPEPDMRLRNPDVTNDYLGMLTYQPVAEVVRNYDLVGVRVQSAENYEKVLVIQELAYPGWEIWLDGERYPNEIFAKLNAVKLPMDGAMHEVVFIYRPPVLYIGGIITILTSLFSIFYLLKADRFIISRR